MRMLKLTLVAFGLLLGLAFARPALASGAACQANCRQDMRDCKDMCKKHAPPNLTKRCIATCKQVKDKCEKDCRKSGSGQ